MAQKKQDWVKALGKAVNLTTNIVVVIFVTIKGGQWLDNKFPLPYLNGMLFTVVGFIFGTITIIKMMWDKIKES